MSFVIAHIALTFKAIHMGYVPVGLLRSKAVKIIFYYNVIIHTQREITS